MPITALPQATVHLLGSTQALTTPTSLVKELIDNALDAKSTSIDILISKNTLDKLEVRDNGHGIASEDFDSLGKRGHTSKLRSFQELKLIGGITLGFRGEALASAVQLGEVSVTTKTNGESIATKLLLKAPGVVDRKTQASHPVGTTISVLRFMYRLPVRKKTFEKEATKTLAKINQLLRSYALARPFTRFSLRVTNDDKNSWSFAPRRNDGIKEAVLQIIGREAALECMEKSLSFSEMQSRDTGAVSSDQDNSQSGIQGISHAVGGNFAIEAFLPKPDADPTKIGTGQYLSVDSRPVSHEKGTMKKIVIIFKKYARATLSNPSEKLKNPFIRMNIKCPVGSYDANVEPAKDDVLFGNEHIVLELAETLLKEVYGELKIAPVAASAKSLSKNSDDFEVLLARMPSPSPESSSPTVNAVSLPQTLPTFSSPTIQASSSTDHNFPRTVEDLGSKGIQNIDEQVTGEQRIWRSGISEDFGGDFEGVDRFSSLNKNTRPNTLLTTDREECVVPLNPWIIAKIAAPIDQNHATSQSNLANHSSLFEALSPRSQSHEFANFNTLTPLINLKPQQMSQSNESQALQPTVSRRFSTSSIHPQFDNEIHIVDADVTTEPRLQNDFVSARNIPEDAMISLSASQFLKPASRNRGLNRQSVSPLTTLRNRVAPGDRFVQTTIFENYKRQPRNSDGDPVMPQNLPDPELTWAMDFEHRKEDATRRRREEVRIAQMEADFISSAVPMRPSPYKNRYKAAIASLEARPRIDVSNTPQQRQQTFKTTLSDEDPRAYMMRRQKSLTGEKAGDNQSTMTRIKSAKLPLEKIPEKEHLYCLVHTMSTDIDKLQKAMENLAKNDLYVQCGNQGAGLMINGAETLLVSRLQDVIERWMRTDEQNNYEVEYSFANLLNSKSGT